MGRNQINWKIADIAGVQFSFPELTELGKVIENWRQARRRAYIVLSNPHSVMMCRRDRDMRDATQSADITLADGVGIVLGGRLLGNNDLNRVTGPSLMLEVCDQGRQAGLRHFFYGGAPGVAEELAARLSARFPGLQVAGTFCPPFRTLSASEQREAIDHVNATRPDVVWVGLGAPKQEKWMADNVGRIHAAALIGVGAAFDFHSGNIPWAPKWVRRLGCEWAYRLAREPRRMWRRNLDSPLFLFAVLRQLVGTNIRRAISGTQPVFESIRQDTDWGSGGGAAAASKPLNLRPARPRSLVPLLSADVPAA